MLTMATAIYGINTMPEYTKENIFYIDKKNVSLSHHYYSNNLIF